MTAEALQQRGFELVDRNWHCSYGEVDLIMRREREWYFIEVRTRTMRPSPTPVRPLEEYGTPEQSLTPRKLQRMQAVARTYLGEQVDAMDVVWHLSFAAVCQQPGGRIIRHTFYSDPEAEPVSLLEKGDGGMTW